MRRNKRAERRRRNRHALHKLERLAGLWGLSLDDARKNRGFSQFPEGWKPENVTPRKTRVGDAYARDFGL